MSQTETKLMPAKTQENTTTFNFADLKTVKWVKEIRVAKQGYDFTSTKVDSAKRRMPIFAWIIASIEMVFISIFLFIHSLPWPNWMMNIIFKIDRVIEHFLESIGNKVEWWWDNLSVRLMRLWERLEALVDALLSLCLFIVYKVFEAGIWVATIAVRFLTFLFAPGIWVIKAILPPPEKKRKTITTPAVTVTEAPTASYNSSVTKIITTGQEIDDAANFSGSASDCESDVSVLSETWSICHTDKLGKSYNKVEMKATAEGRLRAAMYRRVKTQLNLMRKNSINFSRGMTSYARHLLVPKVVPVLQTVKTWLYVFAQKFGLVDVLVSVELWVKDHYFVSLVLSSIVSILVAPFEIINKYILGRKRRSRKTRSMRSESLRRRNGSISPVVPPVVLEPVGLSKSEEPVLIEEPEFTDLRRLQKTPLKVEDDSLRDSALASSIDDLSLNSDSNDGGYSLKGQIIHEEEGSNHRATNEVQDTKEIIPNCKENPRDKNETQANGSRSQTDESFKTEKGFSRSSLRNRSDNKNMHGTEKNTNSQNKKTEDCNGKHRRSSDSDTVTTNGVSEDNDNRKRKISFNLNSMTPSQNKFNNV